MPKKRAKLNKTKKAANAISELRRATGMGDFVERRKTARLDIAVSVNYEIVASGGKGAAKGAKGKSARAAITKDLSAGGCLLVTKEKIPIDSVLNLNIILGSNGSEALKLRGRIVREAGKGKGAKNEYGIAFDEIGKETRRLLADFFFARMYESIGLSEWPTARHAKR